jgi:PAS domain S-box-containing protein
LGAGYLADKEFGAIAKYRVSNLGMQMKSQMQKAIAHLFNIDKAELVQGSIKNYVSELEQTQAAFESMTRNAFLEKESSFVSPAYYFLQGTYVIESASQLQSIMLDYLSAVLTEEIRHKNEQLYLTKSIIAASLLLIFFLFLAFYRSIMLMINTLAETAERMKHGDMREPELKPEDELGHVVHSFNTIAGELTRVSANMQAIFNYAVDGIITIDMEGMITAVNPSAERIFGYTQEELIGNNITMLMPEQYRARHEAGLAAKVSGGKSNIIGQSVEIEGLHKDGSIFPIDLSVNEMKVSGKGALFIGMVRDIRNRKDREAEIRRLATVVEQAVEAIVITDSNGFIQYVNPAFEALNGYTMDEAIGKTPRVLKSGKEKKELYEDLWQTIKAGGIWQAQLTNKRKDGSYYDAEHIISPIFDASGKITNFVGFQRNLTSEKILQSQMEHAQRLESLGVLAGGIAHDFNNILTAIMGNVALAERRLEPGSPARDFLARVEDSTQSAANLCKQMLAYSGKGKFEIKPVNLSDLVEDISRLMEVSIQKNVLLRYHLAPSLPAVEADESQLQQVILNLITNANEAIEGKSGVISLSTGIMHADSEYLLNAYTNTALPEGQYVYLEVSDTGIGMDEDTVKRIFDPFFTTKFTGRGLGMSAVIGIVNSHRGALKIYSEVGRGTTFKILLPAAGTEAFSTPEKANLSDEWQGHGTVLIVDDEETIREVAAIMLEDMGFKTLSAPDGQKGVEVYRQYQNEITCVLLDMTMPRMDGAECFSELRKINPDVQVILSSGYTEQDATPGFVGKGLAGFIQKPYTPEALQEKMQEALKGDA